MNGFSSKSAWSTVSCSNSILFTNVSMSFWIGLCVDEYNLLYKSRKVLFISSGDCTIFLAEFTVGAIGHYK